MATCLWLPLQWHECVSWSNHRTKCAQHTQTHTKHTSSVALMFEIWIFYSNLGLQKTFDNYYCCELWLDVSYSITISAAICALVSCGTSGHPPATMNGSVNYIHKCSNNNMLRNNECDVYHCTSSAYCKVDSCARSHSHANEYTCNGKAKQAKRFDVYFRACLCKFLSWLCRDTKIVLTSLLSHRRHCYSKSNSMV